MLPKMALAQMTIDSVDPVSSEEPDLPLVSARLLYARTNTPPPADSAAQSGMPSEANTQEGEEDALHLVLELAEQQRRQREYEGRRLAARLQEAALKEEQEREVMHEQKEKQEK